MQLFDESCGGFGWGSTENLGGALLVGELDGFEQDDWRLILDSGGEFADGNDLYFLGLGLFDAHERGVAQLAVAGLDGEHGWSGEFEMLEPAVFELAEDFKAGVGLFDFEDQGGVGQAEELDRKSV